MATSAVAASLAMVLLSGCIGYLMQRSHENAEVKYKAQYKKSPQFGDYLSDIQMDTAKNVPVLGKDLAVAAPIPLQVSASQPTMLRELVLARIDADKICFAHESVGDPIKKPAAHIAEDWLKHLAERHFTVRAITSLEAEKDKPLWPVPAGSRSPETFEIVSDEVRDFDNRARETVERRRVVNFLFCAKRPEITAHTKFLAITLHDDHPDPPEYEAPPDETSEEHKQFIADRNRIVWLRQDVLYLVSIGG